MPAEDPANSLKNTPANDPKPSRDKGWYAHINGLLTHGGRYVLWTGVSLLLTCGISAATHLLTKMPADAQAHVTNAEKHSEEHFPTLDTTWWNPEAGLTTQQDTGPHGPSSAESGSSAGGSAIPIDRNARFSTNAFSSGSLVAVSASAKPAYAVLGLGTSSSPISSGLASVATPDSLTFSLSGSLNLVPVDNLAAGGLNPIFQGLAVPEPSTGMMLACGVVGVLLVRRRKLVATAA